jgi:hypothetical protein
LAWALNILRAAHRRRSPRQVFVGQSGIMMKSRSFSPRSESFSLKAIGIFLVFVHGKNPGAFEKPN